MLNMYLLWKLDSARGYSCLKPICYDFTTTVSFWLSTCFCRTIHIHTYIYMSRFNSLCCCWELKPLENPILRQKQPRNKIIQNLWDQFQCCWGLVSSRNSPSSFLGGSTVVLLVQSQQKNCLPCWFSPVQKVLQTFFPALGKCYLLGMAAISKPFCSLSWEKDKRGLCREGGGFMWDSLALSSHLSLCAGVFGFAAALVPSRKAGERTNTAIS